MTEDEYRTRILTMAKQCAVEEEDDRAAAVRRGWLDDDGASTASGRALIDELDGQVGARSVFRHVP
ncbi:hypothetical protein [Roseovarius aestuariivivens]|uniref:hypothetical protein n=1 Tax=Roseovarius aestuariivivens TaxID=1888910 RepID=UPI00108167DC|nr:hypothetical protein [Roseovarius aestuariivivens]